MNKIMLFAVTAIILAGSALSANAVTYRAPAYNYNQNNWMGR